MSLIAGLCISLTPGAKHGLNKNLQARKIFFIVCYIAHFGYTHITLIIANVFFHQTMNWSSTIYLYNFLYQLSFLGSLYYWVSRLGVYKKVCSFIQQHWLNSQSDRPTFQACLVALRSKLNSQTEPNYHKLLFLNDYYNIGKENSQIDRKRMGIYN